MNRKTLFEIVIPSIAGVAIVVALFLGWNQWVDQSPGQREHAVTTTAAADDYDEVDDNTLSAADYEAEIENYQQQVSELRDLLEQRQDTIDDLWARWDAAQENVDSAYAQLDSQHQNTYSAPSSDADSSETVYITNSGSKYHADGCQYLANSKIEISLKKAKARGYTACSVCGG